MTPADIIQEHLLWVQIAIGIVQIITTAVFIRSVRITGRQEQDAREQITLAREQMRIMSSQYRESLRPLVVVEPNDAGPNRYGLSLYNVGLGPALKITCDPEIRVNGTVIGADSMITADVDRPRDPNVRHVQVYTLQYQSVEGEFYMTSFLQENARFSVVDYRHIGSQGDAENARAYRSGLSAGAQLGSK